MNRMKNKKLLGVLIACGVVAILYVVSCLIFATMAGGAGDPDLVDFAGVFSYHFRSIGELLSFSYGDGSVGYFALSAFFYALMFCFGVFLTSAALTAGEKKRKVIWLAFAAVAFDLVVYAVFASGMAKYTKIIAGEGVFEGQTALAALTWAILVLGAIHIVLSMLAYFSAFAESYHHPRVIVVDKSGQNAPIVEETHDEKKEKPLTLKKNDHKPPLKIKEKEARVLLVQNFYD